MSERPKVQHSKCCVVSQPPWVQIPALPPLTARPRWGRAVLLCCPRMPGASREQKRTRGACVKPGPPVPVSWRLIWGVLAKRGWSGFRGGVRGVKQGWSGFQRGRGLKPGPPLCGLLWACVKPGPPVPVPWRLIWGVLAKRGWSGFQQGCGYETWASRACFMAPDMGSFGEAGVVWVSWGRAGCEAGVVWVSAGVWV